MLPLNNKSAQAEEVTIPECPCHAGANVSVLGNVNGGMLINQSCYLTANATTTAIIYIEGTVNLCLNGFRFSYSGGGNVPVFALRNGATLNLYDCGNDETHKNYYTEDVEAVYNFTNSVTDNYLTGGVLCGGSQGVVRDDASGCTFNMCGGNLAGNREKLNRGTVDVTNFNMYGGTICGNLGKLAGGVYVDSNATFNMYGGEIADNCTITPDSAGGIYNAGSFTVSGSSKVHSNFIPNSSFSAILISNIGAQSKIDLGKLNDDAYIGITSRNGNTYSSGNFIFVNNSGKDIEYLLKNNFFDDAGETFHTHNYGTLVPEKQATCTTDGMRAYYKCTECNIYFNASKKVVSKVSLEIPSTGHAYSEEFTIDTAATCTSAGSKSKHCKNCDDKIEVTVIPKLDHDWGEWVTVTAPTCTAGGKQKHTCTREGCGATEEQAVAATGHKYTDTVIPPTCTEDGYTKHTCSVCGDSYDDTPTDATGHTYGEPAWVWGTNYLTATAKFSCSVCHSERTLNASVTHDSTTASCTVAGDVTHTATVNLDGTPYTEVKVAKGEKLPHDSEIVSVTVEPTCTQDGAGQMKCKNCGEEYTDIIPALGHDFAEEFTVDKEPTCAEDGSKSKHCSRCDEKDEVTAIPALGHSYEFAGWVWNEDYTAVADFECSTCHEHISPEVTVTYDEETKTYTASVELDGKQYTDVKAETVTPPVIDPPDKPNPDNPDDTNGDGKKDGFPWWIIAIAAAVLLLFIVLIIIIVKRRHNDDYDDDYDDDDYDYDDDDDDEDDED